MHRRFALVLITCLVLPAHALGAVERTRVFIELPDVAIEIVDEGPIPEEERAAITGDVVREATRALESLGFDVVDDPAAATALLNVRYRGFRNSPARKTGNTAWILAGLPTIVLCVGLPFEKPESTLRVTLLDSSSGKLLSSATANAFTDSAPSMTRREVRRLALPSRLSPSTAESRADGAVEVPKAGSSVVVDRTGNRTYIGKIVSETETSVVLETSSGRSVEIPHEEIVKISRF